MNRGQRLFLSLLAVLLGLLLLVAWELIARRGGWSTLVLPAPSVVGAALWRALATAYLWPHIAQTLSEVLLGLSAGVGLGLCGGLVLGESVALRRVLMPYVVLSQVLPKLALVPLFVVWFGFGTLPTVVITALICFFPLLENTLTGVTQVDAARLELFRVAVVLAVVGAVVGEFMGASRGLGALIIATQGSMDTPLMFAVLVVITLIGWLLYALTLLVERWLLRQRGVAVARD